jgi:hypothetical protein
MQELGLSAFDFHLFKHPYLVSSCQRPTITTNVMMTYALLNHLTMKTLIKMRNIDFKLTKNASAAGVPLLTPLGANHAPQNPL